MDKPVTAVIMLGDAGPTPVERLVHEARRKSAIATFQNLNTLDPITQIVVASPKRELAKWRSTLDFPQTSTRLVLDADHTDHDFHFGKRLISIVQKYNLERILYIGGGSMPLMNTRTLGDVVVRLSRATDKYAITNNLHSSDWLGMTSAKTIVQSASHLPRDNMLGWVLREQAGYDIRVLPPSASTRLDIDTPSDLVALRWHPDTLPLLRSFLIEQLPEGPLARWKAAARVMDTPASQIALIGRVSPSVWRTLQYNSQVWIRVFSEEQGMTASGRWGGGRVQSLQQTTLNLQGTLMPSRN